MVDRITVGEALRRQIDFRAEALNERLSVRQLAEDSGMTTARVARTLSGDRLPSREELDLLGMALGLTARDREVLQEIRKREEKERAHRTEAAMDLARRARAEASGRPPFPGQSVPRERVRQPVPTFGQPDPFRVSTREEYIQALNAVHVWGGSPSLRELERRSKGILRRSSISDMLRGTALPDYDRVVAFLRACGIDGQNLDVWVFIWRRLKALETPEAAGWMPRVETAVS
ncbi:helix-turn-helix domain-containing protein [Streptomyces sp. NPDC001177]